LIKGKERGVRAQLRNTQGLPIGKWTEKRNYQSSKTEQFEIFLYDLVKDISISTV
jgi:hypothetical protein